MVDFASPQVSVTERRTGPVSFPAVSPGVPAFIGITEKGPINEPVLVFSTDDAAEVFGSFIQGNYLLPQVSAFFDNGGERCYICRVAHYTDINDAGTLSAIKATTMHLTAAGGATAGSLTSDPGSFPAYLPAGTVFDGEVDAAPVAGFTILATPAVTTGAGGTFAAGAGGDSITLTINGVPGNQVIDLSTTGATLQDYLDDINAQIVGANAADDGGGQIEITTDREGSGAGGTIVSFGGAAAAKTGLSAGAFTNAGPNNVADTRSVTSSEFAGLMNTGFPGSTSTFDADQVTWTSNTTGASSSVRFTLPATIATLIPGFDLVLHSGTASSAGVNTLLVSASSEGAWGNLYRIDSTKVDTVAAKAAVTAAGSTTQLVVSSVQRLLIGDTISVTSGPDTQRSVITSINAASKILTLSPAITVPIGGYVGTEDVVLETFDIVVYDKNGLIEIAYRALRMSALAGSRYVENKINNTPRTPIEVTTQGAAIAIDNRPANATGSLLGQTTAGSDGGTVVNTDVVGSSVSGLGLYAYDGISDFLLGPAIPGWENAIVHAGIQTYVENRADIYAIINNPQGQTPAQAVDYVQNTANVASSFMGIYYPWLRAVDSFTGGPASVPNVGYVMGVFARTFRRRNFGKAPAGIDDGRINGAIGVDFDVRKPQYDILYPANINAIQKFSGAGISVMGSRTLDPLGDFRQVNVRIVFLVVARVFREGTRFVLFENNNAATRARVTRFMTLYLRGLREAGVLDGESDAEAFFVKCDEDNNTASVRRAGKLVCRVGLRVGDTIEFVDITLEQDTRAIDAEIASEIG